MGDMHILQGICIFPRKRIAPSLRQQGRAASLEALEPFSSVRMRTQARLATTDSTNSPRTQVLAENAPALQVDRV